MDLDDYKIGQHFSSEWKLIFWPKVQWLKKLHGDPTPDLEVEGLKSIIAVHFSVILFEWGTLETPWIALEEKSPLRLNRNLAQQFQKQWCLISSALASSAFHHLESKQSKSKNKCFAILLQACANLDFHKIVTWAILNMAIRVWRVLFLCSVLTTYRYT